MCGKYLALAICAAPFGGSPPHVREIRTDKLGDFELQWITPACAGNTN